MKHLLILLSILLLSSNLFGQSSKKITLFKWKTKEGIQWKEFGNKSVNDKYVGDTNTGKIPEGSGTLFFFNGDKYVGEFKNGVEEGLGTFVWENHEDNEKYIGEFKNGGILGNGMMYLKNGQIFEGQLFENGERFGKGIKTMPDGAKYVGLWSSEADDIIGKREITGYDKDGKVILEISEGKGSGLYVYVSGNKYDGDWKNGTQNGQGIYTYTNGEKYIGEWKDGNLHGQGVFLWPEGEMYIGEFKNDKQNGQGTYIWPYGEMYIGEFKDDKQNGHGTESWNDGSKYIGGFKDDKQNGHGTFVWPDGDIYIGGFKNDELHGQGRKILASGTQFLGEWEKGSMWNVKRYNKEGEISGEWINGEENDLIMKFLNWVKKFFQ